MASKETKAALKSAREAIRAKDFKEALKHCKTVLKLESDNYNALVFVGVAAEALEQPEQALAAYKKAIEAQQEQPLAWQGLCGFYEKSGNKDYHTDLVNVYNKLLDFFKSDAKKTDELSIKLCQLHHAMGSTDQSVKLLHKMVDASAEASNAAWQCVADVMLVMKAVDGKDATLLQSACQELVSKGDASVDVWMHHVKALLKTAPQNEKELREACEKMKMLYPENVYPLTVILQIELNNCTSRDVCSSISCSVAEEIEKLSSDSPILSVWKGWEAFQSQQYKQAIDFVKKGISGSSIIAGWLLLTRLLLRTHDYLALQKVLDKLQALSKTANNGWTGGLSILQNSLKLLQAEALLITPGGSGKALPYCEAIFNKSNGDAVSSQLLIRVHIALGDYKQARQILSTKLAEYTSHELLAYLDGQLHFLEGNLDDAEKSLSAVTNEHVNSALSLFWYGRVAWALFVRDNNPEQATKCAESLLKAARLDSYDSQIFLYLGHYYMNSGLTDKNRGQRCYQKAFDLNMECEEAGQALIDVLLENEEKDLAINILLSITKRASAGSAKWAWLRLGLQQVQDNPSAAITSLQGALRADAKDKQVWECLGEAYLARGSYTAAMKAFSRAGELCSEDDLEFIYPAFQLASIQQAVGSHVEAVQSFNDVLVKSADYVPALKGAGESNLALAKDSLDQCLTGRALGYLQTALPLLTRAASVRPDLACVWKLLGDVCTLPHNLPDSAVKVSVPARLLDAGADMKQTQVVGRMELLTLGGRCFAMAIKQQTSCAALWHDLGVNYYHQCKQGVSHDSKLSRQALQAVQKAVTLNPTNHQHWVLLGVVAMLDELHLSGLAQHSFIKATQLESSSVEAWTCLGAFYMKHKETKLAHEAFKMAQSAEPSAVHSWVGQALIAEQEVPQEAMDLFRHTTELAIHEEGCIGYAHWVCSTLQEHSSLDPQTYHYSIERMAAIPAAADALIRYTERVRDSVPAYNMLGFLLERLGLHKQSVAAFQTAITLSEQAGSDASETKANYARLLVLSGQYDEGIKVYLALEDKRSMNDTCWLALAYYQAGQLSESLSTYNQALSMCSADVDRSQLEAAIAMIHYKGGDIDSAKAAFFRSFQCDDPSPVGLQALCALGLLQNDSTLAGAALDELEKQTHSDHVAAHAATLRAHFAHCQGDHSTARNCLLSAIHAQPSNYMLWRQLATFLLQNPHGKSAVAAHCAKLQALGSLSDTKAGSGVMSLAGLAGGLNSHIDTNNNSLRIAQKALHMYPDSLSNWCSLMASVYGKLVMETSHNEITDHLHQSALTLATHLMAKVEGLLQAGRNEERTRLQAFHLWCVQQYVLLLLVGDAEKSRSDQAKAFLQQACWLYETDPTLKALLAACEKDFRAMRAASQDAKGVFPGQLWHTSLAEEGQVRELRRAINVHIKYANSKSSRVAHLVELALLALQQLNLPECDEAKWQEVFEEACEDALKVQEDCPSLHLLLAVRAQQRGELRLAAHHARLVLSHRTAGSDGTLASLARRIVLSNLTAKKDEDAIKALVLQAEEDKDADFLQFYNASKITIVPAKPEPVIDYFDQV